MSPSTVQGQGGVGGQGEQDEMGRGLRERRGTQQRDPGLGRAGQDRAGRGRAGLGRAGRGGAGQGGAERGGAGQGRALLQLRTYASTLHTGLQVSMTGGSNCNISEN